MVVTHQRSKTAAAKDKPKPIGKSLKALKKLREPKPKKGKGSKDATPALPMGQSAMTTEERMAELQTLALSVEAYEHKVESAKEHLKGLKATLATETARLHTAAREIKQGKFAFDRKPKKNDAKEAATASTKKADGAPVPSPAAEDTAVADQSTAKSESA